MCESLSSEEKKSILSSYSDILKTLENFPKARLIAVSKRQNRARLSLLVEAGHRDFGENYLQEWLDKKESFPETIRWHFIGQVQSRKVATLHHSGVDSVHGFGSESSLRKLDSLPASLPGNAFLQINLLHEEQKGGVSEDDARRLHEEGKLSRISGLMCIPPFDLSSSELRAYFKKMRELKEELGFAELSMGMSSDWQLALDEGATLIRVGTGIFGSRLS